jgi:predicted dehydrogenase
MYIAIIGCGYVADYYSATLPLHPELVPVAVADRIPERAAKLARRLGVPAFTHDEDLLADSDAELVVNLTNPREHFSVSRAALESGRHVYSEKPLAMEMNDARALVDLAANNKLEISSAPCTVLGESAQTLWKLLREERICKPRLVYAEMDDGMVHQMPYRRWLSASGIPWPYKDEFEVGCTLEHAGYYLTWLTAFFGPAVQVTSFASCQIPASEKLPHETLEPPDTPDLSVACLQFASGVVARLTCSILAPHDHSLRIVGDAGVLSTEDAWFFNSPVQSRSMLSVGRKAFMSPFRTRHRLLRRPPSFPYRGAQQIDFSLGIAEMASAIRDARRSRLPADFCLHNNELALAIHHGTRQAAMPYRPSTTFEPLEPMPWAS